MMRNLLVLTFCLLFTLPAQSQTTGETLLTVIDDPHLFNWEQLDHFGPLIATSYGVEGTNFFLRVRQTLGSGLYGSVARVGPNGPSDPTFRPALSGPASSFAIRLSARVDVPATPIGVTPPPVGVAIHLVLRQAGRVFRSSQAFVWRSGFLQEDIWIDYPQLTIPAQGFADVTGGPQKPNFGVDGTPIELGLDVVVTLPTPTGATYQVDLDNVQVSALRTASLPPGVAFAPETYALFEDDTAIGVVSEDEFEDLKIPLLRVGNPAVPLTAVGRWQYFQGSTESPLLSFLHALPPGTSSNVLTLAGPSPNESCPYVVEAQLDLVPGGRVYSPHKVKLYVTPAPSDDCLASFFLALTQPTCGNAVGPAAPSSLTSKLVSASPADLGTLRAFRDQVMAGTPAGRYLANLYTTHSPAAISTFFRRPRLVLDIGRAWEPWVAGAAAMVAGNGEGAIVTNQMFADLRDVLDGFKAAGAPSLARAIEREEVRLGIDRWVGKSFAAVWQQVLASPAPGTCTADGSGLCLNGGRYRVEADWKKPNGETGRAQAVPLTGDSGYFWFFNPANVEILTKVLDGCPVNGRTWSFSAGLTNLEVELLVLDTQTGAGKRYVNTQRTAFAPILDTGAIACAGSSAASASSMREAPLLLETHALGETHTLGAGACAPGPETLCLNDGRFEVEASWTLANGDTGPAFASPLTDDTGTFWFFRDSNVELVVKVLDACTLAGAPRFWVFAGGTTNVGVELVVRDLETGAEKRYQRPVGRAFTPILDTDAFATCP